MTHLKSSGYIFMQNDEYCFLIGNGRCYGETKGSFFYAYLRFAKQKMKVRSVVTHKPNDIKLTCNNIEKLFTQKIEVFEQCDTLPGGLLKIIIVIDKMFC